jgi:hypothetical protein
MSLSKDLADSFKERMVQNHDNMDIAFSIMVLGTNFWPLAPPTHDFLLPPELLPTFERFTRYYQTKVRLPFLFPLSFLCSLSPRPSFPFPSLSFQCVHHTNVD